MPIDIGDLVKKRRSIAVNMEPGSEASEDNTIHISYRPGALTPAFVERMAATTSNEDAGELMAELVADWDMVNGGKPYPCNAENLVALGTFYQNLIFTAIRDDIQSPKPS